MRLFLQVLFSFLFLTTYGQIEVHQEPLHHPVLSNKTGRVLDVIAHPGDTSLMHQHRKNYCYVTLQGGQIWIQEAGGEGRNLNLPTGFVGGYYENPEKVLIHRFANCSPNMIRLIAIENHFLKAVSVDSFIHDSKGEEVLVNNSYFLITKVSIAPNDIFSRLLRWPAVVINLESKPMTYKNSGDFTPLADWAWINQNKQLAVRNSYTNQASIILVQLKNGKSKSRN